MPIHHLVVYWWIRNNDDDGGGGGDFDDDEKCALKMLSSLKNCLGHSILKSCFYL